MLNFTCSYLNTAGVLTAQDLTGKTCKFTLINAATGAVVIAETTTGVTIDVGTAGTGSFQFTSGQVTEAGKYWAHIVVYTGAAYQVFPVATEGWLVWFDSMTQTGEQAYKLAMAAA